MLKDHGMSVYYHPSKANVVGDVFSRLSMGNMSHIDEEKKDLVKEVHQLARLGVWLEDAPRRGVTIHICFESLFVVGVKANQHLDPVLMELKDSILRKLNESFSLGGDGVLRYQNRFCVPNVDDLKSNILSIAHASKYSIHPGATRCTMTLKRFIGGKA